MYLYIIIITVDGHSDFFWKYVTMTSAPRIFCGNTFLEVDVAPGSWPW